MKLSPIGFACLLACAAAPHIVHAQTDTAEGAYAAARLVSAQHRANNMDASARPGIGAFVPGRERNRVMTGALAYGYAFGNGWRSEGEYTFGRSDTFTSGSSVFPTSFNNHRVESQRLMVNAYRDYPVATAWSLYGTAGIGLAHLKSSGWQGNTSRTYTAASQTNLAWSVGAGVSYTPVERTTLELGYRYVDMGTAESGWNAFGNARGLQDEKMRLDLASSEVHLGLRYAF